MKQINSCKTLFYLSVFFLTLMSATFLIMPYAVDEGSQVLTALVGLAFYVFGIIGYVFVVIANCKHKRTQKSNHNKQGEKHRPGIIAFFSNTFAIVFDVLMIISFIAFIVVCFTSYRDEYIAFILLSILVLSVNMHSLFNGRIFQAINNTKGTRRNKQ